MKIIILGVNGFIGSHLTARILSETDWEVYGLDIGSNKLGSALEHPRFHFLEGDIAINKEWIEYHVKKCDVCLPLVAIATPATYVSDPLRVFKLDFEENLHIVRQCQRYDTRLIFPSTSEVYGMCDDAEFDPDTSPLVYGPINKERWIYACSKQLLDRVIYAMGKHENLRYTLFRPFNWVGPGLDSIHPRDSEKIGSSRVVTQFLGQLLRRQPITLVDGGKRRRCFTDVRDGIEALMRIIARDDGSIDGGIFNLGNPHNDHSIRELAEMLVAAVAADPQGRELMGEPQIEVVDADDFYGEGYQDVDTRKPSIAAARERLAWAPQYDMPAMLAETAAFFVQEFLDPTVSVYDRLQHERSAALTQPV